MRTDHGGGHSRIIVAQLVQVEPEVIEVAPDVVEVVMESIHQVCDNLCMESAGTTRSRTPGTRLL